MKKVLIAIAFMSASAVASPALVYYPQAQGVQAIYDNVYVGYSAKGVDETNTTSHGCVYGMCTDVEREWFNYNVQVGGVAYTEYGVYPFAGLTYSKRNSHEDKFQNDVLYKQYDHSNDSIGFEAGVMYEFYPHALAAVKFSTEYEEVQFGLGFRF
ncbi:hypothetical protein IACHDJAJ_00096 [Aeromonas phage vB_AdhS_TS3]|nr:hypothetical protein IACHDJAJ_00096 [Aeromonas phage vB_AdhS_TS3]